MQRNILITSAASDLALELCRELVKDQSRNIIATTRTTPLPDDLKYNRNLDFIDSIDLTNPECIKQVRTAVDHKFKDQFTLINFSGSFWDHKRLVDTSYEQILDLIMSHYISLSYLSKSLIPLMIERGGGGILAFSCNSVQYNYPELSPFTCAKAAIETFVRCIANEYSEQGIIANAIALPTMRTDKVIKAKPNGDHNNYIAPDELARIVIDTCLNASIYINGNTFKLFKYSPSFYGASYFDRNPSGPSNVSRS